MQNAHALVVGIADYQHLRKLPKVRDAQHIAELLTDRAFCGYPRENVRLLLDADATQAALRSALADLARRADADSTVLISFSGHGGRVESGEHAGQYLLPVDAAYPPEADLARTSIAGAEFTEALRAIPSRKVLVIFDCCHAGGIGEARDILAEDSFRPGLSEGYYEQLKSGRGRVILASSRGTESSYVLSGATYGLFTKHLLDGLRGGAVSDDGLIRIFDLFEFLQPRVTADHPQQHPVFKAELEENFAVALYRGGQKGEVPRVEDEYRYDAYISYTDREPDASYVWDTLLPRLEGAGLRVAVSNDSEDPGVARVVGIERAVRVSKRTVVVLSEAYLDDHMADFQNILAQSLGIDEGAYRLLPVRISPIPEGKLPTRLGMLATLDLTHPRRAEREFDRLVKALRSPLPRR